MGFWSSFKQLFSEGGGAPVDTDDRDDFGGAANSGMLVNPATGLPMDSDGSLDVAGNPFGVSRSDDFDDIGGGMSFMNDDAFGGSDSF